LRLEARKIPLLLLIKERRGTVTSSVLAALAAFAFVTTVTPGPNNLMLLASGANFGFKKTLPHMVGIVVGLSALTLVVGGRFDGTV
jgi:threonine/homoserine/homoserine lactone efflux protein